MAFLHQIQRHLQRYGHGQKVLVRRSDRDSEDGKKDENLQEKVASLTARGCSRIQREVVDKLGFFIFRQSLTEWPSLL